MAVRVERRFAATMVVLALSASCGHATVLHERLFYPQTLDVVKTLLVVPFENLTPFPEAGLIVADQFADELRAWQGYRIVDRGTLDSRAQMGEFALPLHWGRAEAIEFGRKVGADAVFFGSILEFGYLREHRAMSELATAAVAARIVSVQSGRVVWSGTLLGTAGSDLSPGRPPLMEVSRGAIETALAHLFREYEQYRADFVASPEAGATP